EETLVDVDIKPRRRPHLERVDAMRLRHPGAAVEVEMDDAFRAAQFGDDDPALDRGAAVAGNGADVVGADADGVVTIRYGAPHLAGRQADQVADEDLPSPLPG